MNQIEQITEDRLSTQSQIIAAVLDKLVTEGITRQDISSEDFEGILPTIITSNENYDEQFYDCVSWLKDEGFLRYGSFAEGTNGENCFYGMIPTARCFGMLEVRIEALGNVNAKQVLAANTSGDKNSSLFVKSGAFVGSVLGGFTKTIAG